MNQEQWQEHIEAYLQTNLSKRAYAEEHNLVYSQFLYWCRKHIEDCSGTDESETASSNPFISVTTLPNNPQLNSSLGAVEFPGGIRLVIHHTDLLQPLLALCLGRSM